jgi:hypothetical protein
LTFSASAISDIERQYATIAGKYQDLLERYVWRSYTSERAREYATHGLARRLKSLIRSVEKLFELLAPGRTDFPSVNELTDAANLLQAFLFNVFGSVDNLAWVWVLQRGLTKPNGSPLPPKLVGLTPKNQFVRNTLSAEFRTYLETLSGWFDYLENYRHAAAHRIPLYIPPYVVFETNQAAYALLQTQIEGATRAGRVEERDRLEQEALKLAEFRPVMMHSYSEGASTVYFHPQVLIDFSTVYEIGIRMQSELDR